MKRNFNVAPSVFVLAFVIVLGYILVIYSVIFAPPPSICPQLPSENMVKDIASKDEQIRKLSEEITSLKKSVPTVAEATPLSHHSMNNSGYRPGLLVLGMHRSGTSIVGGLINKMGLKTGSPLIQPAKDNEKGFFERIDVVLQNDILMRKQHVDYASRMYQYNTMTALKDILTDDGSSFKEGTRGLKFLNDPKSYPWMLKDPRLCVTFRTWLPLLNFIPAVLFTYRHPMDVALSFLHRYEHFQIGRSLKMWYVYNRRAIEQSHDLCRVVTSHAAVMSQPLVEMGRIFEEVRKCGVPAPHRLTLAEVEDFVDPKLQHGKSALKDTACEQDVSTLLPPSVWPTQDKAHIPLYREVMRAFCAMEDGSAFNPSFVWDMSIKDA